VTRAYGLHLSPHNKASVDPSCISHTVGREITRKRISQKASHACDDTDIMVLPRASCVTKAEATEAIDDGDESFQLRDFVGVD
jgi:hypothetical protein